MLKHLSTFRRRQLSYPNFLLPSPRLATTLTSISPIESKAGDDLKETESWKEWDAFIYRLSEEGYINEPNTLGATKIRTACLNFARDRFELIRSIENEDLKALVAPGCPTLDRKVVNSAKRLRAHLGIVEGSVCDSCSLRGNCGRAYLKPLKDQGARTVDVVRVLVTYGLDSVTGSVENNSCLNQEGEESARRLMKQMTELNFQKADSDSSDMSSKQSSSMNANLIPPQKDQQSIPVKQGDWICPKCSFINFARNIKCLSCNGLFEERLRSLGEHQDHLPLKKGDWLCDKCHFLNFAKNSRCLQCKEMPPKRALSPGEWICESCNFINFRKNMICLKCDHRRNKTSKSDNNSTQLLSGCDHYSEDYKTRHTQEETSHRYSIKPSQCRDVHRWKPCADERYGSDNLQPLKENSVVSRSTIFRGQSVLSSKIHGNDQGEKIGTKSNRAYALSNTAQPTMADKTASNFVEEDNMSSWFGFTRKV